MFRSPLFAWSPRPDHDQDLEASPPTHSPSRFSAFRSNVRTMVNGSSIYSQSPAPNNNINTPKTPFLGFWNRQQPSNATGLPTDNAHRESHDSRSPLHAHHTAGSYIGAIAPQDPQEPTTVYSARHPADVPLPHQHDGFVDPEIQQLADEINGRRHKRRKHHKKRKHHRTERSGSSGSNGWVRRREERGTTAVYVRGSAARGKMIACVISGTVLLTILAIYLAIALTNRSLGQEIHILFIMVLLTITIFFCHSLIRLCMLMLNPPHPTHHAHMPDMMGAGEGFQPIVPIRVHLRRDEETADLDDAVLETDMAVPDDIEGKNMPPPPPPAYGLWRSSVRVDPNLLHWQRADDVARGSAMASAAHSRSGSLSGPAVLGRSAAPTLRDLQQQDAARPPSYVSENGVSYITEAAPRNTTNVRDSSVGVGAGGGAGGLSEIHPAWRPGYAMSEIRGGELPVSALSGNRRV